MRLGPATRRKFHSMWVRNFRLFFVGQLISNSGNWLTMVGLVLLVLHRTNRGLDVGLVTACQFGPILVLAPWAGLIADRRDKRRLLLLTQSLEMAQSFVLGALAFTHNAPLWMFYATAVAGGCMLAFDNPIRRSFVTQMVPAEDVSNAVTLYSALVNCSRIFGPAMAGFLVVTVGFGWAFTLDAVSYIAVLAALLMMRTEELRPIPITPRGKGQVREGIRYVRQLPELWLPFLMLGVIGALSYNFSVTFPLFVEHGLGSTDTAFTLLYSVFSVGSVIGAVIIADRKMVAVRHVVFGAAALGATLLLLSASPNVAIAFPIIILVGMASITYMTSTTAIVQVHADPRMHGRVLALQTVLLIGTTPIGSPVLGAVADAWGGRAPLVIGGIAALVTAAWGYWMDRRLRRGRPDQADAEPTAAADQDRTPETVISPLPT